MQQTDRKPTLRILGVHGLGDHRHSPWTSRWADAVRKVLPAADRLDLKFDFVTYDDIFADTEISWADTAAALWKLSKSGIGSLGRRHRGALAQVPELVRWTAGYVVAWVQDAEFQRLTRARVLEAVARVAPDFVIAHSLGSLVTYNAFSHADAARPEVRPVLSRLGYVSFGSQIGNPFVIRNLTPGRIAPLPVRFWYHLYNEHDDVFTAPIRLHDAPHFAQIETPFDIRGIGDHRAEMYLSHRQTVDAVWAPAAVGATGHGGHTGTGAVRRSVQRRSEDSIGRRRALLVGINDYPQAEDRLEGCVNDVFTMSAALQECGFPAAAIRTCLDGRATAEGILDRLQWLLDDPAPGDERVFYFSGHGARLPDYGEDYEPDRMVEALAPWDFDWSVARAISDDQIHALYSQLPFGLRFAMIFDCCHAGGLRRHGGARAKGLTPPDDVRHRALKWDARMQMWVPRDFLQPGEDATHAADARYFGRNGATARLGRASMLRPAADAVSGDGPGPYLPLILEACGEDQFAYEYRHGVTSHGAFTYSLVSLMRRSPSLTFRQLVARVGVQLADLGYAQRPSVLGPQEIVDGPLPWRLGAGAAHAAE